MEDSDNCPFQGEKKKRNKAKYLAFLKPNVLEAPGPSLLSRLLPQTYRFTETLALSCSHQPSPWPRSIPFCAASRLFGLLPSTLLFVHRVLEAEQEFQSVCPVGD